MTLTQERLKELLSYNPETGEFKRIKEVGNTKVGDTPGHFIEGYRYVTVDGRTYPAHRLVFLFVYGEYPSSDVDHKNLKRDDNRLENLRITNRRNNMLNISSHKDSVLGKKNIFYRKDTGKYSVRATVNGRYRSFGCFEDLELAELVAKYVREKYHGEYARD